MASSIINSQLVKSQESLVVMLLIGSVQKTPFSMTNQGDTPLQRGTNGTRVDTKGDRHFSPYYFSRV